jgi:hypothetical protein
MHKYTHLPLHKDVEALAGYYTPLKEGRLKYHGREVLYIVGQAAVDSSCCGAGNYRYVIVPGYIINWQKEKNEAGLPVTEVETISDKTSLEEMAAIIRDTEHISQVEFW